MKIFYFQAKKELESKQNVINLLSNANNAMMEEVKAANQEKEEYKRQYEAEHKLNRKLQRQLKKKV